MNKTIHVIRCDLNHDGVIVGIDVNPVPKDEVFNDLEAAEGHILYVNEDKYELHDTKFAELDFFCASKDSVARVFVQPEGSRHWVSAWVAWTDEQPDTPTQLIKRVAERDPAAGSQLEELCEVRARVQASIDYIIKRKGNRLRRTAIPGFLESLSKLEAGIDELSLLTEIRDTVAQALDHANQLTARPSGAMINLKECLRSAHDVLDGMLQRAQR